MIVTFDIKAAGDLSPVIIANNIGKQLQLPYEVVGTINNDERVQLEIEVKAQDVRF